jgi:hypothetical protein
MTDNLKKNLFVFLSPLFIMFFAGFAGFISSPNGKHRFMELVMILLGSYIVVVTVIVVIILLVNRGENVRKWEPAGTALYLGVYLVVASEAFIFLFNDLSRTKVLVWLIVLIGVTMVVSRLKKQRPLISALCGSLLGPLGVVLILLAKSNITAYREEDKDMRFYEMLARMLDRQCKQLVLDKSGSIRSRIVTSDLVDLVDYFSIDLIKVDEFSEKEVSIEDRREQEISSEIYIGERRALEIFRQLYTAFNNEFSRKFGSKFKGIDGRIEEIERKVDEFESALR